MVAAFAACLAGPAGPATAGDGSGTDNLTLLRGAYGLTCSDEAPCPIQPNSWPSAQAASGSTASDLPGNCATLEAAGIVSPDCLPSAASAPASVSTAAPAAQDIVSWPPATDAMAAAPAVDPQTTGAISGTEAPGDNAVTGDWQIALRGSWTSDGRGQRYKIIIGPEGSLTWRRARGEMRLAAGLDLAYQPDGGIDIDSGSGAVDIDHALARDLVLRAALALDAARETVNAVTSSANEEKGALSVLGTADFEIEKQMGRTGFTLGGTLSRRLIGDTVLTGGVPGSNADRAWWGYGVTARASYELTPILSTTIEAKADRAYFDAVAAATGARSDNWTYQATLGLSGKWRSGLTASLYGGYGLVQYDSALLTSGGFYVLGGSLTMPFGRTGELTASLDTGASPTDSVAGASTAIDYAAALGARYLVNDWLTLRAALGGTWSVYPGANYTEYGLSANAGLDWRLGSHTSLTADYTFGADWTPTANGLSHTVSLGMLVHR